MHGHMGLIPTEELRKLTDHQPGTSWEQARGWERASCLKGCLVAMVHKGLRAGPWGRAERRYPNPAFTPPLVSPEGEGEQALGKGEQPLAVQALGQHYLLNSHSHP